MLRKINNWRVYMLNIDKLRRFLMEWVLAPNGVRIVCHIISRCTRTVSTLKQYRKKSECLYVLGNGPSLKTDLTVHKDDVNRNDCIVVNFMGLTPAYMEIRPSCYVLADSLFFKSYSLMAPDMRREISRLEDVLVNKTTWPMTLITLGKQDEAPFIRGLKKNPNITILYAFNKVPVPLNIKDFSGWICNRYSPPGQTVLNTAIYFGIVWKFKKIVLLGADTSFHSMVRIEQDTNRIYTNDEHFYGITKRYLYQDSNQDCPTTMDVFLKEVQAVFYWYKKLREFADWAGVRIVNASSFSWIDAFDRA